MGLPNVARYPEATVTREDERLIINFGGCDDVQTMGVPLKYVNARDVETVELMLLAQLQQIGYRTRRGPPNA
jgi:hypothetical protein